MKIFLVVKVTDVNYNPLNGCTINVDFVGIGNQVPQPAGTDGTFEVQIPDQADIISVTVEKRPSFFPANQHVKIVRGTGSQNPSLIFTGNGFQELNTIKVGGNSRGGGDFNLEIYFALGQLVNARSDVEAVKRAAEKTPSKILGLDAFICPVIDFTGLTVVNSSARTGWNLLVQTAIPSVAPAGFMMYARRVEIPQLIGIWVPGGVTFSRQRNNVDPATKPLNFHIFYHPSPGVLSGSYPFSFAFVDLICRYLFYYRPLHKSMVNQHFATEVNNIFIFPVGDPSGWNGALGGQDSLLRLLQELAFFVQRMDGIPIPLQKVGKCAVSGFSAAGPFVNQAMTLQNAHFDQNVLREIYAFDLRQVDPQTFANSLAAWRKRNAAKDQEPRKFRIYTTDDSWFDPNANVDRTAATFTGLAGSRESAGINSSVVLLPLQFWASLNPNVPGDGLPADKTSYQIFSPDFKSVHQMMPALFMQHALKNSQFK